MGHVEIAADVLDVGDSNFDSAGRVVGWQGDPLFMVELVDQFQRDSADSWERLALALGKMAHLFMRIDDRGNMVAFEDLGETDEYTPNFVSDPNLSARGVSIYADTKAELSRDMGEAMLRAMVEELRRLPFDVRISGDDGTDRDGVNWQPPHLEMLGDHDPLDASRADAVARPARPGSVVIERAIRCVLRDGVPDIVVEYLDADDGWTTLLANARLFERGPFGGAWEIADRLTRSMLDQA